MFQRCLLTSGCAFILDTFVTSTHWPLQSQTVAFSLLLNPAAGNKQSFCHITLLWFCNSLLTKQHQRHYFQGYFHDSLLPQNKWILAETCNHKCLLYHCGTMCIYWRYGSCNCFITVGILWPYCQFVVASQPFPAGHIIWLSGQKSGSFAGLWSMWPD